MVKINTTGVDPSEVLPAGEKQSSPVNSPESLWPNDIRIPVIVGTGEFGSGKTLFGMTIDPANTFVGDIETSSETYYRGLGIKKRVDFQAELLKKFPKGHKPIDLYLMFMDMCQSIQPGQYRVIMFDPVSEIETGLSDWVEANPKHFGKTSNQYQKMEMLKIADAKSHWKTIINSIAAKCECLYLTVHLRKQFKGTSYTGRKEPKGKETLLEMASLYLWFERNKDAKGNVPSEPSANVVKSRLSHTAFIDGKVSIQPVLPPRIPTATPPAIRRYILSPPDYLKLKAAERVQEQLMSEEDKLLLQAGIEENRRAAAEAEASRADKMYAAAARQAEARAATVPPSDQMHEINQSHQQQPEQPEQPAEELTLSASAGESPAESTPDTSTSPPATAKNPGPGAETIAAKEVLIRSIRILWLADLGRTEAALQAVIEGRGKQLLTDFTYTDLQELKELLERRVSEKEGKQLFS